VTGNRPRLRNEDEIAEAVLRCRFCETLFEEDVADPTPGGAPRCPQCGLSDTEPVDVTEDDFVVRKGTKFR
jgi:hypothetical protein